VSNLVGRGALQPAAHFLPGGNPNPCDCQAAQARKVIALALIFLKTVRHFFPELPGWLDQLPDTRFEPMVRYHRRFRCWWRLLLFGLGLDSRRSADNDLRDLSRPLTVFDRLARTLKAAFPPLRLCLTADSLCGCGRFLAAGREHHWHFVVTS
jgi:hypothetical protein